MLNPAVIQSLCRTALAEDIGSGDATTLAIVPEDMEMTAVLATREDCVCAGLPVARGVFAELDAAIVFEPSVDEGELCAAGQVLATISGRARAILSGERTALNFLQRLCGIATMTHRYAQAVGRHRTAILDTRKTTPGLRVLEKYAVRVGGGQNHRFGLYDRIMIKDNHRELARTTGPESIIRAVKACRQKYPTLEVEVEADTLDHVEEALAAGADIILLDNMGDDEIAAAVELVRGLTAFGADGKDTIIEASGGITLERVARLAALGVDCISVGALTHSVRATDIGLDIRRQD